MFKKSEEYGRLATGSIAELLIRQRTKWLEYRDTVGITSTGIIPNDEEHSRSQIESFAELDAEFISW